MLCQHKTQNDHSYLTEHGRVWICSNCKERQKWGARWSYFGNVECSICGLIRIDHVACCEKCADKIRKNYDQE